jgi:hypothetical protein
MLAFLGWSERTALYRFDQNWFDQIWRDPA